MAKYTIYQRFIYINNIYYYINRIKERSIMVQDEFSCG